jgi:TatA/E family protein of Tat protein translocase
MFRWEDMLVVLVVGLILFGPNKLVDFAKALGSSMHEFKKAANPEGQAAQAAPVVAAAAPVRRRKPAAAKKKKKVARA